MDLESKIRLFTLANSLIEHSLDKVEETHDLDLGRKEKVLIKEEDFYAQFESEFRKVRWSNFHGQGTCLN